MEQDCIEIMSRVLVALARAGELEGLTAEDIPLSANLFKDLGFTSLQIVDVGLCIEAALGIEELPLQDWIDDQSARVEDGFTVRSLIEHCTAVMSAQL